MFEKIVVFIFGSLIGSFLNVCIYRMPLEKSIVKPRSYCPHCKKTIYWYDNVPLISYLILGGKCRYCKGGISFRYFLVELITAGIFLGFYIYYGKTFEFILYTVFASLLLIAAFVDIAHRIIPDEVSLGGVAAGFLFSIIRAFIQRPLVFWQNPVIDSLLGIIIGGGIIYSIGKLFDLFYFKLLKKGPVEGETESMGGGDVKLLAMIGAFLGWKTAVLTFFLAPFIGIVFGLFNLAFKRQHTLPYGPFLSAAALICLFWADTILKLIFFDNLSY